MQKNKFIYLWKYVFPILLSLYISITYKKINYTIFTLNEILITFLLTNLLITKNRKNATILSDILCLEIVVQLVVFIFGGSFITRIMLTNLTSIKGISGKFLVLIPTIILAFSSILLPIKKYSQKICKTIIIFVIIEVFLIYNLGINYSPTLSYYKLIKEEVKYLKIIKQTEKNNSKKSSFKKNDIKEYREKASTLNERPNIILIFTEGLSNHIIYDERNIMPNLKKFSNDSLIFTGYYNHTFATYRGIIGQLYSGFQLDNFDTNNLIPFNQILESYNYNTTFINTEPYNKEFTKYLESFKFKNVINNKSKTDGVIDSISDKTAYEMLFNEALSLSQDNKPFLLTIYTFGTHMSFDSTNKKYKSGNNIVLNRFYDCDYQFGKFLKKFKKSELFDNTIIIFTTDHASYTDNDYVNTFDKNYHRLHAGLDEIPLFIYHKDIKPEQIEVNGKTSLDFAPTILDYLDYNGENYFLGDSLFSNTNNNKYDNYFFDGTNFAKTENKVITGLITEQDFKNEKEMYSYITISH